MCSNPNLDLVKTKFGKILSICSQDIDWKYSYEGLNYGRTDRRNDRQPNSIIATLFQSGAINIMEPIFGPKLALGNIQLVFTFLCFSMSSNFSSHDKRDGWSVS